MSSHLHSRPRTSRSGEDGYVLLTLLLILALMIIFAAAITPSITFEIRRDREEEMIHRGVQYARAIRAYYKKFGRYPTKIEDLENTNNLRFLRKRYKDPITGKDFRLLHFGEVKLTFSAGIGGGTIPGANPVGSPGGLSGTGGFGQTSTFGAGSALGANLASPSGQNQPSSQNVRGGDNTQPGTDASESTTPPEGQGTSSGSASSGGVGSISSAALGSQVFGGGPIVGVVSFSKQATIREFNHKRKYNEWQFIYDPATDRGGLLMTPNQPPIMGFGQPGTQNLGGQSSGGLGTGLTPAGIQNTPNQPPGGLGTPTPPNNPPEQQ
jgi:type II secretory pathway pseudopilin PulG